jgi:hypothetical protein
MQINFTYSKWWRNVDRGAKMNTAGKPVYWTEVCSNVYMAVILIFKRRHKCVENFMACLATSVRNNLVIAFWTRSHFSSLLAKFTWGSQWEPRRAAVAIPLVHTAMLSFHLMTRSVSQSVGCARRMSLKHPEWSRLQSKGQFKTIPPT